MDLMEKDDTLICMDAFDIYHIIAWAQSMMPRQEQVKQMVPDIVKEKSHALKKHVAEHIWFEIPYKDNDDHLYYMVQYTAPDAIFDPKIVGLAVFDEQGQLIKLDEEKYDYIFWNLMYSRSMRVGVHIEMLQRALPVVSESYGETSFLINHILENHQMPEQVAQSFKALYRIYDLNYRTSLLSRDALNEIKEFEATIIKNGYLIKENVEELFDMICPFTTFYLYNRILVNQYRHAYAIVEEYLQSEENFTDKIKIISRVVLERIQENLSNEEEINLEKAAELYAMEPDEFIIENHPLLNEDIDESNICTISWNTEVDRIYDLIKHLSIRNLDS